jgi:type II secretory pathway pseudopilin PulG
MKKSSISFYTMTGGQTLVELLIALSIAIVVITSMTIAVVSSLNNAAFSKNQTLATQYAQEGMEIVKQMQVSNYQTFSSLSGRYCLSQTCSALTTSTGSCGLNSNGNVANCSTNVNSNLFIRQIDMFLPGSAQAKCLNTTQATVSVLWTDGKCPANTYCHSEQIVSCFSNANIAPAP